MKNFIYYSLEQKLKKEMLATCPGISVYNEHVLKKTKDSIREANKLVKKSKKLSKFKDVEISEDKEIEELKGILRSYQEMLGKRDDIPNDREGILKLSEEYDAELDQLIKDGEAKKCTVFMRSAEDKVIISSHMILGNIKEILRVRINNGSSPEVAAIASKTQLAEMASLDLKVIEDFIEASNDIMRDKNGNPLILERPALLNGPTGKKASILMSQQLPVGTKFKSTLRVCKDSLFTEELLHFIFDQGKNLGLGQWRGSGGYGAYLYKLTKLEDYEEEKDPEGFN